MYAIQTRALRKVYPAPTAKRGAPPPATTASRGEVVALKSLDLDVAEGEFFGLLGPNGAGKTTTIGILTTRVRATAGTAQVSSQDVTANAVKVRQLIGVVPQRPNPDRSLNVLENLIFHAAYFGISRATAHERAMRLLGQVDIADKANAKVDEMSGGQQQRLMIVRALIHEPRVLFLDEPTVGLDPQARLSLWEILRALHAEGRTIVMTTHYMEEADKLCDRIAIIDRGELLELDTPEALKERAPGGTLIEVTLGGPADAAAGRARALEGVLRAEAQGPVLRVFSDRGGRVISPLIQAAEDAGASVHNISLTEPSLETLFVARTGRKLD